MTAAINNNKNFKNVSNQNFKNKKQNSFQVERNFKIESKSEQVDSGKKLTLKDNLVLEKLIPSSKSRIESNAKCNDIESYKIDIEHIDREKNIRLGIDPDKMEKIEALLFPDPFKKSTSSERFSACIYVCHFNEKYSKIKDLSRYRFDMNEIPRLEKQRKYSQAIKEYEVELKNANLNEKEMIEVRKKIEGVGFVKYLLDENTKTKMDDYEKFHRISENCGNKMHQSLEEYFKKSDENHVEYARKLFEFFDSEENQGLINEFLSDVTLVMKLDKIKEYKEMLDERKTLDEIKAVLEAKNPNILDQNNSLNIGILNYDLNSLHNILLVRNLENKLLRNEMELQS